MHKNTSILYLVTSHYWEGSCRGERSERFGLKNAPLRSIVCQNFFSQKDKNQSGRIAAASRL
jgi:hypothetical protein